MLQEPRRRISAAIYGWDRPLLTFTYSGFEHVAQMASDSFPILSSYPNLSGKPPLNPRENGRFLERTMLEKNGKRNQTPGKWNGMDFNGQIHGQTGTPQNRETSGPAWIQSNSAGEARQPSAQRREARHPQAGGRVPAGDRREAEVAEPRLGGGRVTHHHLSLTGSNWLGARRRGFHSTLHSCKSKTHGSSWCFGARLGGE